MYLFQITRDIIPPMSSCVSHSSGDGPGPCLDTDKAGDGLKVLDAECTEGSHTSADEDKESAHSFIGGNHQHCTGDQ
jgi:hypothetical protein